MGEPRTRLIGGYTNQVGYIYGGPTGAPTSHERPSTKVGGLRTMNDEVNRRFASRRNRGEIVFSPMNSDEWLYGGSMVSSVWSGSINGQPWEEGGERPYAAFPNYPQFPSALSDDLALAAAVNEANANVTPSFASVAVTVAELDAAKVMFRAAGQTARNFMNVIVVAHQAIKGKKIPKAARQKAINDVCNTWLQVRYGWLPLIYDMQGCIKALTAPYNLRETARGKCGINRSGSGVVTGSWRGTYGYSYTWKQETMYRAGVLYENQQEINELVSTRLGLSITDMLTVPWDLVPLSFVVDWFIDVGDWLRAITPKSNIRDLASWTTVSASTEITLFDPFVSCTQPGWTGHGGGGGFVIVNRKKSRTAGAKPTIPGYGSGLTTLRSIDAAALAFGQLKGVLKISHR